MHHVFNLDLERIEMRTVKPVQVCYMTIYGYDIYGLELYLDLECIEMRTVKPVQASTYPPSSLLVPSLLAPSLLPSCSLLPLFLLPLFSSLRSTLCTIHHTPDIIHHRTETRIRE